MKLYEKTAAELSQMLRKGECSAAEILGDVRECISEKESVIGAYITLSGSAEKAAEAADRAIARGEELHPLAGIPVAVKDNISTRGLRTTCASRMLDNYIPPFNATVIDRLEAAGAVITGKTNMDEFAMGSATETSYFHKTHNPHNTEFSAGGSSGGSAAAIAAGEAITALGSDTGGSVRQPASLCSVVGMKPTYGRVSRYGLIAYASSLEQIGVFGKTVRDTAMMLGAIGGRDCRDATSSEIACPDFTTHLGESVRGLRVGVPEEFFSAAVDDDVREAVWAAIKALEANGAQVRQISLPAVEHALSTYYIIASAEASSNLARFDGVRYGYRTEKSASLTELYENTRSESFGTEVKRRIMLGTFVLSSGYCERYYKRAKNAQRKICAEFTEAFSECDIIAAPTYPTASIGFGKQTETPVKLYMMDKLTVPANLAGLPAISVPCGKNSKGMPIGLQLIGRKFDEQTVFDTANAFEKIVSGFNFGGGIAL